MEDAGGNADSKDEDRDSSVLFALYVDTDAALARVLNVTAPAVRKAAEWEKIAREPDGRWEVFAVLDGWRASTNRYLQRPAAVRRPWLDPYQPLTWPLVVELIWRTRAAGGTVSAEWDGDEWPDVPDPRMVLRSDAPLDVPTCEELEGLLPWALSWHAWCGSLAERVAERFGLDAGAVRAFVYREGRERLAWIMTKELQDRGWLGDDDPEPPTA